MSVRLVRLRVCRYCRWPWREINTPQCIVVALNWFLFCEGQCLHDNTRRIPSSRPSERKSKVKIQWPTNVEGRNRNLNGTKLIIIYLFPFYGDISFFKTPQRGIGLVATSPWYIVRRLGFHFQCCNIFVSKVYCLHVQVLPGLISLFA